MFDDVLLLHSQARDLSSSDTDQTDHISLSLSNCTTTFPLFLSAPILQNCPPAASLPASLGWRDHQHWTRQSWLIGKSVI